MNEYMALTSNADDLPSLFVNATQPLHSLLSTAGYRIRAVKQPLENLAISDDLTSDSVKNPAPSTNRLKNLQHNYT